MIECKKRLYKKFVCQYGVKKAENLGGMVESYSSVVENDQKLVLLSHFLK